MEARNGRSFHEGEEMSITDRSENKYIGEIKCIQDGYIILTKVTKNEEPITDDVIVMYNNTNLLLVEL